MIFPTLALDPNGPVLTQSVSVTNRGGADLTISGTSIAGDTTGSFESASQCVATLHPGSACIIDVSYRPTAFGPVTANLAIASDAGAPAIVALMGSGLRAPSITDVTPTVATPGATITINGIDLASTASVTSLTIGGLVPRFTRVDTTSLTATVPDTLAPGPSVAVVVSTVAGTATGHIGLVARPVSPPVVPPVTPPVVPPVTPPAVPPVAPPVTPPATPPAARAFSAVEPFRALDTRPHQSGVLDVPKSKVGNNDVLDVTLTGLGGVPSSGVAAVSMNVTVVDSVAAGFVTAYPCGDVPPTSSVNFAAGQIVANSVIAAVSDAGHVCFFSNAPTDIVVDVNGWYPSGSGFTSVSPVRAVDTRLGDTRLGDTRVGSGTVLDVPLAGTSGPMPGTVVAVSMNVTVDGPSTAGFLTVYPCGAVPDSSSVNFVAGRTVANAVITPVSSAGDVCIYSSADTDVIVDVNGWFEPGASFNPVAPARTFDTRPGHGGALDVAKRKVDGGSVLDVLVDGLFGQSVAGHVAAVSMNVTVDGAQDAGYVAVFPCGSMPEVSSVNFVSGQTVANAVIAPVSASGHVCFYSSVPADVVVDVNGWFSSAS